MQLQYLVTFLVIFLVIDYIFNVLQGIINYFWGKINKVLSVAFWSTGLLFELLLISIFI